jgi:N-acetylmuramic acid 6-phosphate etherase
MAFEKFTEEESRYHQLEEMSIKEILANINQEDKTVPDAVEKAIPQIEKLVSAITDKMLAGGRLFYIGAGTSGRLGVLDASEIPPTYGMPFDLIIGVIAGGETAIRKPVENAEDDGQQGWLDLEAYEVSDKDLRPAALRPMSSARSSPAGRGGSLRAASSATRVHRWRSRPIIPWKWWWGRSL